MPAQPHPFDRLFPPAEFLRPRTLLACACSALGSLILVKQLLVAQLLLGLLTYGGELRLSNTERAQLEALVAPVTLDAAGPAAPFEFKNQGLLPLVWRSEGTMWGNILAQAYRSFPPYRQNVSALSWLVAGLALMQLLRLLLDSLARRMHIRQAVDATTQVRLAIHRQVLRLGPADLEGHANPQAMQLFTTVVDTLRDGIVYFLTILGRDVVRLAVLLIFIVVLEPLLALLCLVPLAGCWALTMFVKRQAEVTRSASVAKSQQDLRLLSDCFSKTQLIKSFGMEALEQEQFEKALGRFQRESSANLQAGRSWRAAVDVVWTVCIAGAIFLAGWRELNPEAGREFDATLIMSAAMIAVWFPLQRLWNLRERHQVTRDAALAIQTWLDIRPPVEQVVGAKFLNPLSRVLEFQGVSYSTPHHRKLLEGLSFKIPAGKTVGLLSSDPLETIAAAYMLPRFIEPQEGRILFDGEEIAWVTLESLRAETVLVTGKEPFLTGSIRDNISGGGSHSLPDVTDAAKFAHAHNFIVKLPQGYESVIGEHGENFDVSQSYRIGLARAILRKPALLIIQEPTEALDDEIKAMLDDAYKRICQNRTVIFLPNRLHTIRRCDYLVFLHKGKVAAAGTHAQLVQSSALYRHWEYVRFSEFRHEFESPEVASAKG